MPPRTPDVWTGIRNADRAGPVCPQNSLSPPHRFRHPSPAPTTLVSSIPDPKFMTEQILRNETELLKILTTPAATMRIKSLLLNQSEDCLFLDIYTPVAGESGPSLAYTSLACSGCSICLSDEGVKSRTGIRCKHATDDIRVHMSRAMS